MTWIVIAASKRHHRNGLTPSHDLGIKKVVASFSTLHPCWKEYVGVRKLLPHITLFEQKKKSQKSIFL